MKNYKNIVISICLCLVLMLSLFSCKEDEPVALGRVYIFEESEDIMKPSVWLDDEGNFQFSFSTVSSYIGIGKYTVDGDILTLRTDDGEFTYTFKIVGKNIVFDAENSSHMRWFGDFEDGSVFVGRVDEKEIS